MNRRLNSVVKIDVEVNYKRIQLFVFLSDNFERRSEVQIIYLDGLNINILNTYELVKLLHNFKADVLRKF